MWKSKSKPIKEANVESSGSENESEDDVDIYKDINHAAKLYFLDALYQLGWKPEAGKKFTTKDVLSELKIPEQHLGFCHYFFRKIAELGYMEVAKEPKFFTKFWFIEKPPTPLQIADFLLETIIPLARYSKQAKLLREFGANMKAGIMGEVSLLTVLFPTDPKKVTAEDAYLEVAKLGDSAASGFFKMKVNPRIKHPIIGDE